MTVSGPHHQDYNWSGETVVKAQKNHIAKIKKYKNADLQTLYLAFLKSNGKDCHWVSHTAHHYYAALETNDQRRIAQYERVFVMYVYGNRSIGEAIRYSGEQAEIEKMLANGSITQQKAKKLHKWLVNTYRK